MNRALLLIALLALAGCRTVVETPPEDLEQRDAYQTIANALPEANFGWGTPPGITEMTPGAKRDTVKVAPEPLKATERGFRVRYQIYRTRTAWIPYSAISEVSYSYEAFPNAFFAALIVMPLQIGRTTVVVDTAQADQLMAQVRADIASLEAIAREGRHGSIMAHAKDVQAVIDWNAATYGAGKLALSFDFPSGVPAWIPYGGKAKSTAEAFAWAMANPDAPELPDEPEPEEPAGEAPAGDAPQSE
jgi:hypothetical protein